MAADVRRCDRVRGDRVRGDRVRGAAAGLAVAAGLVVGSLLSTASLTAQVSNVEVSFASVANAERTLHLDIDQDRRVLDVGSSAGRRWLSIREHLRSQPSASGGDEPDFRLDLLGVSSALTLDPTDVQLRSELHSRHAGFLHRYGSLRIEDPITAAKNYHWLKIEDRQLLGRPVRRVAIIPRRFGANPWILDIDLVTSYPLYRAEYDAAGNLLAELEVTRFDDLRTTGNTPSSWWSPTLIQQDYATLDDARAVHPNVTLHFPDPAILPPGFTIGHVKIVQHDLRPEPSVVVTYTDGLDELFVITTLNAPRPALPLPAPGPNDTYALFAYRDLNVGQFMFHDPDHQVRYMVIGKHAQAYLEPLARELMIRVVSNGN